MGNRGYVAVDWLLPENPVRPVAIRWNPSTIINIAPFSGRNVLIVDMYMICDAMKKWNEYYHTNRENYPQGSVISLRLSETDNGTGLRVKKRESIRGNRLLTNRDSYR